MDVAQTKKKVAISSPEKLEDKNLKGSGGSKVNKGKVLYWTQVNRGLGLGAGSGEQSCCHMITPG